MPESPAPPRSVPRRVTTAAGVLVALSGLLGLVDAVATSPLLRTAAPVALLVGVAVLALGGRGGAGLARRSVPAAAGLLLWALPDVVAAVTSSAVGRLPVDQLALVSYAQLALSLVGLAGGVVAAVLVVRHGLLRRWASRALVVAVAADVLLTLLTLVPSLDLQLALLVSGAFLLRPVAVLLLGAGLLLHGRGSDLRAAGSDSLDRWRASTDVDGSAARRRAGDEPAQESRRA